MVENSNVNMVAYPVNGYLGANCPTRTYHLGFDVSRLTVLGLSPSGATIPLGYADEVQIQKY